MVCRGVFELCVRGPSSLERDIMEGDNPVNGSASANHMIHSQRVGLFENAAQIGWYIPSKAKYRQETDSEQVP